MAAESSSRSETDVLTLLPRQLFRADPFPRRLSWSARAQGRLESIRATPGGRDRCTFDQDGERGPQNPANESHQTTRPPGALCSIADVQSNASGPGHDQLQESCFLLPGLDSLQSRPRPRRLLRERLLPDESCLQL